MNKICSLDYINKEEFDADIISACGKKLFSKGDKITPEILLSLYFKAIFTQEPIEMPEEIEPKIEKFETLQFEESITPFVSDKVSEDILEDTLPTNIEFDEDHATRIMQFSYNLGVAIGMQDDNLEELKKAAYYYQIGETKLPQSSLSDPDFKKKRAAIGYNLLVLDMKMPEQVAEVTRMYLENYNCVEFELNPKEPTNIPYAHIVAIVDYYDNLINKKSNPKEKILNQMLKLGGNKFNTFVLHKFINLMRNSK